jgi:hypothetical protein
MKTNIIIICVLLAAFQVAAQEKVSLSYKMEPGKTYRYKTENTFTATQEMMGNEMKVTGDLSTTTRYEVEKTGEDGNISLITTKQEAYIHTRVMGKDTTIRQTKDLGKKTGLDISAKGTKLGTTIIDTLSGEDRFMGGDFEFQELPENPVAIGEKWTKTSVDTTKSADDETITTVTADYELAGTEQKNGHQCLRVNYRKVFEITGKMKQMGMEMFSEGEGETTGTYWFDAEKGLFIAEEFTLNQDITIAITGQTQMTIPSSQTINMKVFLIE